MTRSTEQPVTRSTKQPMAKGTEQSLAKGTEQLVVRDIKQPNKKVVDLHSTRVLPGTTMLAEPLIASPSSKQSKGKKKVSFEDAGLSPSIFKKKRKRSTSAEGPSRVAAVDEIPPVVFEPMAAAFPTETPISEVELVPSSLTSFVRLLQREFP